MEKEKKHKKTIKGFVFLDEKGEIAYINWECDLPEAKEAFEEFVGRDIDICISQGKIEIKDCKIIFN